MGQTLKRTEPGLGSRKRKRIKRSTSLLSYTQLFKLFLRWFSNQGGPVGWCLGNWGAVSHTLALERQLDLWKELERGRAWEKQGYVVSAEKVLCLSQWILSTHSVYFDPNNNPTTPCLPPLPLQNTPSSAAVFLSSLAKVRFEYPHGTDEYIKLL